MEQYPSKEFKSRGFEQLKTIDQFLLFLLAAVRAEKGNPMSAEEIEQRIERALEKRRSEQ